MKHTTAELGCCSPPEAAGLRGEEESMKHTSLHTHTCTHKIKYVRSFPPVRNRSEETPTPLPLPSFPPSFTLTCCCCWFSAMYIYMALELRIKPKYSKFVYCFLVYIVLNCVCLSRGYQYSHQCLDLMGWLKVEGLKTNYWKSLFCFSCCRLD